MSVQWNRDDMVKSRPVLDVIQNMTKQQQEQQHEQEQCGGGKNRVVVFVRWTRRAEVVAMRWTNSLTSVWW